MQSRNLWGLFGVLILVGCATPQERAIHRYCSGLANTQVPAQIVIEEVLRQVQVGDRIAGYREKCTTTKRSKTERDKDGKEREVVVEERVCRQVPILVPIFEPRLVREAVDLNAAERRRVRSLCEADALSAGLFKEVRD
jgi:hypothetical protein